MLPGWCTPPHVSAWFSLCKHVWSRWVRICLDLCVTTAKLPAMLSAKEPNSSYCFHRSPHNLFFAVLFFYTCFKPAWDIRGIPLWLCNMIWGGQGEKEGEKKRERERFVLLGFVSYCALIFLSRLHICGQQACRWPSPLFPWPTLISPVYCKPPLITLNMIKANTLITACFIIVAQGKWEAKISPLWWYFETYQKI